MPLITLAEYHIIFTPTKPEPYLGLARAPKRSLFGYFYEIIPPS